MDTAGFSDSVKNLNRFLVHPKGAQPLR